MFFNGLIKRYPSFLGNPVFEKFEQLFMARLVNVTPEDYRIDDKNFKDSQLFRIASEFPHLPCETLTAEEQQAYDDLITAIHDVAFDVKHRVVLSQFIWMLPGQEVLTHYDAREVFGMAHRFNVIVSSNADATVTVWAKGKPNVLYEAKGNIYELNNRLRHSAANKGDTPLMVFIIDFVPADFPILDRTFWTRSTTVFPDTYQLTKGIIEL